MNHLTYDPANDYLDREHQDRVNRTAKCDTSRGRNAAARDALALLTEECQELSAMRDGQGADEHVEACRNSRWHPYKHLLEGAIRMLWRLDALFWLVLWGGLFWRWTQFLSASGKDVSWWIWPAGTVAAVSLGVGCARLFRGFGEHVAISRFTDPDSADDSIDTQVRFTATAAVMAVLLLLAALALLFFAPPAIASWATSASGVLCFLMNIALGCASGVGGNAVHLLSKPAERDAIDCQLDMKERTRRHLGKYVLAGLLALVSSVRSAHAATDVEPVWVWAIDVSGSVDASQRAKGIEAMVGSAFQRATSIGARYIQIVRFSDDLLLADMTWVPVPVESAKENCESATAEFVVSKGLGWLSPSIATDQRDRAVAACLSGQATAHRVFVEEVTRFKALLLSGTRLATRASPTTRIVPLLKKLISRPYVRAIDVLTDGIDNSGVPRSTLSIPQNVSITMIITPPDPRRATPTLDDVLAAAEAFDRVPGLFVTSVSEYPGFVKLAGGR